MGPQNADFCPKICMAKTEAVPGAPPPGPSP